MMPGVPIEAEADPDRPRASASRGAAPPARRRRAAPRFAATKELARAPVPNLHRPADLRRGHRHRHHAGRRDLLFRPAGRRNIPTSCRRRSPSAPPIPGASAETVADTVAAPIEQQINGVDDMLYMSSQSTGDGRVTITVTFKLGTDLDQAQVLVQNRVALAEPSLPEEVRRFGVVDAQVAAVVADGDQHHLARPLARPRLHVELHPQPGPRPADPRRRHRRRDDVRRPRLCDAGVDRPRPRRRARDDRRRGGRRAALAERPGRRRHARPAALRQRRRLSSSTSRPRAASRTRRISPTSSSRPRRTAPSPASADVARVELGADDYGVNGYLSGEEFADPRHHPAAGHQCARRRRRA